MTTEDMVFLFVVAVALEYSLGVIAYAVWVVIEEEIMPEVHRRRRDRQWRQWYASLTPERRSELDDQYRDAAEAIRACGVTVNEAARAIGDMMRAGPPLGEGNP